MSDNRTPFPPHSCTTAWSSCLPFWFTSAERLESVWQHWRLPAATATLRRLTRRTPWSARVARSLLLRGCGGKRGPRRSSTTEGTEMTPRIRGRQQGWCDIQVLPLFEKESWLFFSNRGSNFYKIFLEVTSCVLTRMRIIFFLGSTSSVSKYNTCARNTKT